jgi:hypothetical protein
MTMQESFRSAAKTAALLAGVLAVTAGCQDLKVENLIEPDRDRALSNPSDVQALIGGGFFPNFFRPVHGTDGGLSGLVISLWGYASSDFTSTLAGTGSAVYYLDLIEPRRVHPNAAVICSTICEWGPRDYWARIGSSASILYDGLQVLDKQDMRITENNVDVTARARAFAKFMQGWTWGYAALAFDRVHIVPETVEIPGRLEDVYEFAKTTLVRQDSAILIAVEALDEAIRIAQANPTVVTYPAADQSNLWFGSPAPITNQQFIQMANTLAARLLVLGAASPEDRATKVPWQRVLTYTANGVKAGNDFEFVLSSTRTSQVVQRLQNNTTGGTTNARWDYRTIGPADQSGAYQAWIAMPEEQRNRFNITTPDRRITGATPTAHGSYTGYRADNNGFLAERGTYFLSAYQWQRHKFRNGLAVTATTTGLDRGSVPMITADENNLLRAEALLRTSGASQAVVDLINITRTRPQLLPGTTTPVPNLPPVTLAGVPTVNGQCVPKRDDGQCGTLATAIRYERMLELAGQDALRGYADSRGFGMLPNGSPLLFAVPGNVLQQYGLQNYTFGGVGNPGSASYNPWN